jgi:DNA-binding response OmpR family regulator
MMTTAKILVVEDEFLVAAQIEAILRSAGWRVIGSAGTLASAVSLARKSECDAAVLDVNLRGERIDEVASILSERRIPFLFVSGYGRGNLPTGFRESVEFLAKPFSDQMLVQTVGNLLRKNKKAC